MKKPYLVLFSKALKLKLNTDPLGLGIRCVRKTIAGLSEPHFEYILRKSSDMGEKGSKRE